MHSASLTGRVILICEDEPLVAIDIANTFTEAGARVVSMRSLRDAVIAVEDAALSAAILDDALSDGDSLQLYERLKERNIPVVLHSGYSQPDGAYSEAVHVPKPAPPQLLVTTVEALLRSRPISN